MKILLSSLIALITFIFGKAPISFSKNFQIVYANGKYRNTWKCPVCITKNAPFDIINNTTGEVQASCGKHIIWVIENSEW